MAENSAERVNYYQGQYLGAQDFSAEQNYHRDMRRRHNVGHHTWGIAAGLKLVEREAEGGGIEVWIEPGMAVDGYGREIIVWRPHKVEAAAFQSQAADNHYKVWIGYDEEQVERAQGGYAGCRDNGQFNRTREGYRIFVEPRAPQPEGVIVDGQLVRPPDDEDADLTVPPDLSVPYQEFPTTLSQRWLVRLGSVHWDGAEFAAAAAGRLDEGRRYVGNVTAELLAPAAELHIRDRTTGSALAAGDEGVAVTVDGSLRVERDVTAKADIHIDGGLLDFRLVDGSDGGQLALQRGAWTGGDDLRIRIGSDQAGENRLAVGPQTGEAAADFRAALVVLDNGNVGIGVDAPEHPLQVGNAGKPALAVLDSGNVGVGTGAPDHALQVGDASAPVTLSLRGPDGNAAAATLAFEDDGGMNTRWFKLLYNSDANLLKVASAEVDPILTMRRTTGNVGIGTDSPLARLHIESTQDVSLAGHGALLLGNPSGENVAFDRNEIQARNNGNASTLFLQQEGGALFVRGGQAGGQVVVQSDGNVGIGTTTPAAKLDVRGTVRLGNAGNLFALGAGQELRLVTGDVDSNGTVRSGVGFSAIRLSTGNYRVTFTSSFGTAPIVLASLVEAVNDDNFINVVAVSGNQFEVRSRDYVAGAEPDPQDSRFTFIALGAP